MTENHVVKIKRRYAIIGGLWVMAVALVFSITNSPNFPQQPLNGGVVILLVLTASVLLMLLLAITLGRTRPRVGKTLILICTLTVLVYGFLGIFTIGIFILPAAFLLYLAVAKPTIRERGD